MAGGISQCVLFLTDSVAPRIVSHFDRLAGEAPFQTFYCCSDRADGVTDGVRIDYESAGTRFRFRRPTRPLDHRRPFVPGTVDLLWLQAIAAISQRHSFEFYWIVEYDADFSGHWSLFFNSFLGNRADLIATRIKHRRNCEPWMWWQNFGPPAEVTSDNHIKAFFPVVRISSRLVTEVSEIYDRTPCSGHHEALLPTLCSYFGLVIEDMGNNGPFGRGEKWLGTGHTYTADCDGMPNSYFQEHPSAFDQPNVLWHPVKVAGSPNYDYNVVQKQK
jgi:hypothetical protein